MKTNPPSGHRLIQTGDGSATFFSEAFAEACHSTSGARSETLLHYIKGCRIEEKIKVHAPLRILEVGLGLGVGFLTTYETLPQNSKWDFVSLERDKNLLEWFRREYQDHKFLGGLYWEGNLLRASSPNVNLTILCGDARLELPLYLKNHPQLFHAIYQDAFSPKKNPTLWTRQWFNLLKEHSHPEVLLSTYSASTSIRKSLLASGWKLFKGEKFGPKRASTRAMLCGETDPEILAQMERSPVGALSDETCLD